MSSPWYPPPVPSFNLMMDVPPSNSREMRNKAEKQRRDRLNAFIAELASLVPMVAKSTKRMDKTSILRLTATHLRIYQTLIMGKKIPNMQFPKHIDQLILEQLVCEQLGGFLLIVIPTGKIVFVSHTVENLLGHLQTDLMGQSLFQITSPDDHDRLKMYLQCEAVMERDWKKYFNVKLKRAGPRSESAVFEPVKMMGMHRTLPAENGQTSPASSTSSNNSSNYNYDIMVFFVKLCRPEPLIDRLIEASKDEYVTRHLIDGRIINSDQRISIVAGYMIEEVSGISAFKYMHRDDVRWVIIALRQMYDRGESRGSSCYRLQTRNGLFIYLRTFGFLEIDDQGTVESFVCVNTMVSEVEGKQLINEMKKRYSALINNSTAYLTEHESLTPPPSDDSVDLVEDPAQVELAVSHLMRNLPSPGSDNCSMPSPSIAQSVQENQDWLLTDPPIAPSTYPPVPTSNVISIAAPCSTTTAVVATTPPTETTTSPNKLYQVRIKTASKRPSPTVDATHYGTINCNNKRAKTSQQLSSIHHQSTPYLRRSLIMSDCKPQPEKSIYRRDQLLKQKLQKK